jgi:GNAT superfamily N-acetyltransferase
MNADIARNTTLDSITPAGLRSRVPASILRLFDGSQRVQDHVPAGQNPSFPQVSRLVPAGHDTRPYGVSGRVPDETIMPSMRIELARIGHLDTILELVDEASTWLKDCKDTNQWANPWPNRKERDARVLKGLQNGKTWIVWDGNTPAATATIATTRNPAVWSNPGCTCDLGERAVYVHRLITARKYAGWGLGAELIDWAGLRGRRKSRARWIRIDVWTSNEELHGYYVKTGFEPCGTCADLAYPSGALFQKPVSAVIKPSFPLFVEAPEPQSRSVGSHFPELTVTR